MKDGMQLLINQEINRALQSICEALDEIRAALLTEKERLDKLEDIIERGH